MRYADGGGLTAAERAKREAVHFEAAEMFERGVRQPEAARRLRVSRKSAYAWRTAWRDGGTSVRRDPVWGASETRFLWNLTSPRELT